MEGTEREGDDTGCPLVVGIFCSICFHCEEGKKAGTGVLVGEEGLTGLQKGLTYETSEQLLGMGGAVHKALRERVGDPFARPNSATRKSWVCPEH